MHRVRKQPAAAGGPRACRRALFEHGVLGKKPDIRYKSLAGMAEATALQAQILKNAAKCLKKGGRLVYSTCTLNPAENEEQVRAFLQQMPEFCVVPFEFMQPGMRQSDFGVLSLPPETGMDGFYQHDGEKDDGKRCISSLREEQLAQRLKA